MKVGTTFCKLSDYYLCDLDVLCPGDSLFLPFSSFFIVAVLLGVSLQVNLNLGSYQLQMSLDSPEHHT